MKASRPPLSSSNRSRTRSRLPGCTRPDNYLEKLLTDIAAGTPPDTAFVGSDIYRTFIRDGLLLDITDPLKADPLLGAPDYFIEPQEEGRCTSEGKWYGIGSCWVAPHIYYNADIFAEEGIEPPSNDPEQAWTWDRFVEVANALTKDVNGNHPTDSGFDPDNVERYGVDWPHWSLPIHSLIQANNGYWIDPNTGLLALDQPAATEAIQKIADLVLVQKVNPAGTAMQALGMTNTQMLETGKLAMAIDGSWALSWMYKIKPGLGTGALPGLAAKTGTSMQAHLHSGFASTKYPEAVVGVAALPLHALLPDAVLQDRPVAAQPDRFDDGSGPGDLDYRGRASRRLCRYPDEIPAEVRQRSVSTAGLGSGRSDHHTST